MTIASTDSKVIYGGNGSTATFAIPFMFHRNEDIKVILTDIEGLETIQTISTDYQLTGVGESTGGTCTMTLIPEAGQILVILRDPAMVQEVDYVENDAFPAATHEAALDKLTTICQSLSERLDRTITFRVSSAVSGVELPKPSASKILAWNEEGDNLTNRDLGQFDGGGTVLLPLAITEGGTGANSKNTALSNLGFGDIGRAIGAAQTKNEALSAAGAEPANADILKADETDELAVGFTAQPKPMETTGPTPATGALQTIDTSAGPIDLAVPSAAGVIRFIISGSNALNIAATYDSIDGSYDAGKGLAQGEISSDGTHHFITIVNKAG